VGRFAVRDLPKISRGSVILTNASVSRMERSSSEVALLPSDWRQASSNFAAEASLVL
jgi:hypothetical protein